MEREGELKSMLGYITQPLTSVVFSQEQNLRWGSTWIWMEL